MEIKCQLDATEVFIADLIACSTCFGHHYAHHQELKSIIQWLLRVVFSLAETMALLKPIQQESMLLPSEQFHIQSLHQAGKLIPEQSLNDPNPLFQLALTHPHHTRHKTEPVNQHPANRTHNPQLHTRPAT